MSIRRTTFFVFGLAFLGLAFALNFTIERTVFNYLEDAEYNQVILEVKQAQTLFDEQSQYINRLVRDWAWWDDTYEFVLESNENYVERNLVEGTFSDINLDLVVIFDEDENVVFQTEYRSDEDALQDISPEVISQLKNLLPALEFPEEVPSVYGVVSTKYHPLIIAVAPVFPSDMSGDPVGVLVFGQYFDQNRILGFSKLLQLAVTVNPWQEASSIVNSQEAFEQLEEISFAVVPLNQEIAGGYFLMKDILGDAAYLVMIEHPRVLNASSIFMKSYLRIIGIALPAIFFTLSYILLSNLVLRPLTEMRKKIDMIGEIRDFNARLPVSGQSELTVLSSNINLMLDALQESANEQSKLETRFQTLLESMDDIVATFDVRDQNIHLYGKAAKTFGIDENIHFSTLQQLGLSLSDIAIHSTNIAKCLKGEHVFYEWDIIFKGQWIVLQISFSPIRNIKGKITGVVAVCRDITMLKKLEMSLQKRIADLKTLNQASQVFIRITEESTLLEKICELLVERMDVSAAAIYKLSDIGQMLNPVAAHGMRLKNFQPVPFSSDMSVLFSNNLQDDSISMMREQNSNNFCALFLPKGGSKFRDCMVISLANQFEEKVFLLAMYSEEEQFFYNTKLDQVEAFGTLANMALQKEEYLQEIQSHRQQLETLSHRLVNLQEEERRNIALELHDEIGQLLTVLKISLDISTKDSFEDTKQKIDEAQHLVDTLLNQVRELSWSLRPPVLDDLGLLPALIWLFNKLEKQTGLETSFYHLDLKEDRYPAVLETAMFRIIQESLTNVERHAGIEKVTVRLWHQKNTLNVQIADQGQGFEYQPAYDLLSIRQRVKLMQGQLQVDTAPGKGCRLTILLPIPSLEDTNGN